MQGFEFYIELQDIHELQSGGNSKNRSTGHAHLVQWKSNVLNKENCNYSSTLSLCNLLLIDYLPNDIDSMMIIASQFGGTAASLWKLDLLRKSDISKSITQTSYVCVTLAFAYQCFFFD